MRLLCITDIHGDLDAFAKILADAGPVDVVLLGGDITNFGTPNVAERFVEIAQQHCPVVFAVAGNCDSPEIDRRLSDLGVSLFGRGVEHDGVGFYGVSAMPPWTGTMYELSEDEIGRALQQGRDQLHNPGREKGDGGLLCAAPAGPFRQKTPVPVFPPREVIVSHPPPRDTTVDRTRSDAHVGSTAVRQFIDRHQPSLVVCGHIHEARGIDRIGRSVVVNCGPAFHGSYAIATMSDEVQVDVRNV